MYIPADRHLRIRGERGPDEIRLLPNHCDHGRTGRFHLLGNGLAQAGNGTDVLDGYVFQVVR